ncbi:MAG: amidohydrolase [Desulfobacterales bacterium]|nr:amidohydrolase [Desulfobacterales bacterium]
MKTLYTNGTVVTMDPRFPEAESLVTEENRIIGIGNHAIMAALAGSDCTTVDMQGGALFPGFNETHNHLSMYAVFRQYAYLGASETIAELIDVLKRHGSTTDAPIIVGYSYDDTLLKDGRQITRYDLDEVSTERPVIVIHISMHLGFLNSAGLQHYGITRDTPNPVGGEIHQDEAGPNGRLDEIAWFDIISQFDPPDSETYLGLLEESIKEFNRCGITGVHDAGLGIEGMPEAVYDSYRTLESQGKLSLRVFLSLLPDTVEIMNPEPLTEMRDERLKLGGVKLFIDGSIQAETAALMEPYARHSDKKGELVMDVEEFEALVTQYHSAGHHLSIHGNGDAAIEAIITAFEKAQEASPQPDIRHMLIHSQMAHRDHLKRMRKLGVIPSFFCMHVQNWGDRHRDLFIGPERAARIDPAGEAEAMGLPFTLHVDTPILPIQILDSIQAAVTRETRNGDILGPDQCTTQYGAVAAYTSMAALCSRSENERGTLSVGKLADMTLLSQDITMIDPKEIKNTIVRMTVIGGDVVYCNDTYVRDS